MNFELTTLFILGSGYLVLLFGIAWATDHGWIPRTLVRNPVIYVLSLGVFASVWAYYTSIGNAQRDGYGYMAHFIGISLTFLFSPLLLKPLLDLTERYQLSSLADLMAFRYRSPWAGTLSTLVILIAVTPLLALQIRAVADTANLLSADESQGMVAFGFCSLITLFAILFGTSQQTGRNRHDGLIMAIAFESLVKLFAFLMVGLFAVFGGFGGLEGLDNWLQQQPGLLADLGDTDYFSSFHLVALLFFTAAIAMPHMFYVTFNESNDQQSLSIASWGLPLYFMLLSLPVLPILWAGLQSGSAAPLEYLPVVIGIAYDVPLLSLLAYVGGLSAASGLIIVITLALSNMCLNHLILPMHQPAVHQDIYRWLQWYRRLLITAIIWAGFLFYSLPDRQIGIEIIGTVAFTACLQFLPGIVTILYWPPGNKKGFITGLMAGFSLWFILLLLPLFSRTGTPVSLDSMHWHEIAALSLIVNTLCFIFVSLRTVSTDEERSSAEICAVDTIRRRKRSGLVAKSPDEFIRSLSKPLGQRTAEREVKQALLDLDIAIHDQRPASLRSLRSRLEANLSGLMGPAIASEIIDGYLPYSVVAQHDTADVNVIENRIESYRSNLTGLAVDLDNLRRYHRQILLELPLGVCSLGSHAEIVMWNRTLEAFTSIDASTVVGLQLGDIDKPWCTLLTAFLDEDTNHAYRQHFRLQGQKKTVNLHKAWIQKDDIYGSSHQGVIILIEDITEFETLEQGLTHSERLASIGRLAAGVAHEIGNPITGIACLAQTIRDEYPNSELNNLAEQIIEQTNRTSKILQSLVNFAHAGSSVTHLNTEMVNVSDCMKEALMLVSLDKKTKQMDIETSCEPELRIEGDSQKLVQILVNLINNARDASQSGTTIAVQASRQGEQVRIAVTDEGVGIPAAIRDRVFDPFFTTKEAGEGTGLGLSLVFSIVGDFKGDIDILSPVDKTRGTGTSVVLLIPLCQRESEAEQATGTESITDRGDKQPQANDSNSIEAR